MESGMPFEEMIDEIYKSIVNKPGIDGIAFGQGSILSLSREYEYIMNEESRKKTGSFYTEKSIVKYMLEEALKDVELSKDPYIRILDPSCGCGYFLTEAYDMLKEMFMRDIDKINADNPELNLKPEGIHGHIIKHNLYGADLDTNAVKLAVIGLMLKDPSSGELPNIMCCDSIINWEDTFLPESEFWRGKFDIIIGNPPYIGHKQTDGEYRKKLNSIYGDIFKDKADISFCFIKSSVDRLKVGGKLCFITSRYFLESPSGRALRGYIKGNCNIEKIIDFYGVRIMKGISVDPCISLFRKTQPEQANMIRVIKAEEKLKELEGDEIFIELKYGRNEYFRSFEFLQRRLKDEGWTLCDSDELSIIDKIEKGLKLRLSDVCESFQGIITGCDRAFIVDEAAIDKCGLERSIIKPWIKSSNIGNYKIVAASSNIIYSDLIDDPDRYKNAMSYIEKHRERLENRRECKKGVREWYKLQWGRERGLFEGEKIIFPYKSSRSRFALDAGSYWSADIYGMVIRVGYEKSYSYEFLLGLLNSRLYEFYFKSFGKKLGEGLYDYYPNTVMRLLVPDEEDQDIKQMVKDIIESEDEGEINHLTEDIDSAVYRLFGISLEERDIIEGRLMKL